MQDIRFRLFNFPVAIQPFFWFLAGLLGALNLGPINNMPVWVAELAVFMLAVLISILTHELGHAFTFRHLYGVPSVITIHGFGGETAPQRSIYRSYSLSGTLGYMFLSFAGPFAGFILAGLLLTISQYVLPEQNPVAETNIAGMLLANFLMWTAVISIIWGVFNLLPIYPMDGGHIVRGFLTYLFPRNGRRYSLFLSLCLAVLLAVFALRSQNFFIVFLFGYFAYMNYQELCSM